jgi:hypothetical protein
VAIPRAIDLMRATALAVVATTAFAQTTTSGEAARVVEAQAQGNALAAAMLRADYVTVAATACSPVLARVGGAAALARLLKVSFKVMQQQGRQLVQMRFGPPDAIVDAAQTRFALVPYRSVVRAQDGRVSIQSWYLGVQNKDAPGWCFIDTAALTETILRELYPGAPAGLQLPPQAQAVITHDGRP